MKAILTTTFLLLLLIGPAVSQENPLGAPTGADAFLAGLTGFDETLCGETDLKVMINGSEIGSGRLAVASAPEGSGGIYEAVIEVAIKFGPMDVSMKEVAVLDAKLALVSSDTVESTNENGTAEVERTQLAMADGKWTWTFTKGDEVRTSTIAADRPNHQSFLSALLISRRLGGGESGVYVFQGVKWPENDASAAAEWQNLTLTLRDPTTVSLGEKEMEVREILAVKEKDDDDLLIKVGTDGRFVSFSPSSAPLEILAADLVSGEAPEPVAPGRDSPIAVAALFYRVLSGGLPFENLDPAVDWTAIHKEMAAENPAVAALEVEALKGIMLTQFRNAVGNITEEQVDVIVPMLKVEDKGDTATVTLPGESKKPFRLRKTPTGWLITSFPG